MESTPRSKAVDSGSKQHTARRSRRRWVMVLALVGFGAGTLAPVAGLAGGDGEWHHGYGMPEPEQRQVSQRHVGPPIGPEARMHSGPVPAGDGAGVHGEGNRGMDAIPMPAMHLLYSLRAAHSTRECGSHPRLCALVAAHARTGIGPVAWKRIEATPSLVSEAEPPGIQDAIAASYAVSPVRGRTVRTRLPDES